MSQELTKTEKNELSTQVNLPTEEVLSTDVVIPRLLLCQGLSDAVAARKAQQGDMIRSTTLEKVGDPDQPVEIVPLTFRNRWMIQEVVGGKPEFRGWEDRNARNETLPWEYQDGAKQMKRVKVIELFALLPRDIEAEAKALEALERGELPDLDATLLPVVVTFRSTSYKAGQGVVTHFAKVFGMAQKSGKAIHPHDYVLELSCAAESNAKGAYYVFNVKTKGAVNAAHKPTVATWYNMLTSAKSNIRVDDNADDGSDSAGHAPAGGGGDKF